MPRDKIISVNLDDNEAVFFARELEFVKAQMYDIRYPEYQATMLIPVDTSAGPGAESIVYHQFDTIGVMKLMASYGDDAPRADVKGKEFLAPVKSIRGAYGYSIQDIRNAMFARRPLKTMKANAARRAYDQTVNKIGWFADGTATYAGLTGFLYNANTTKSPAPVGAWLTGPKTADQIIGDVNFAINNILKVTLNTETADTLLLPVEQYTYIATTPRSSTSDTTILEFLRRVHPGVTFYSVNELDALDPKPSGPAGPTDVMVAYKKSPDKLQFAIPQPFEQFPPQERNMEQVVNTHARVGGVQFYYPLSCHIVEGI